MSHPKKPRIAVMLDENTSRGGTSYELSKNYMHAVMQAGGIPYAIPYCDYFIDGAEREFDGFFSVGGAVRLPPEWYVAGQAPLYPASERTPVEIGIMKAFLKADKPVLGSCNGMQVLAGIHGCLLASDLGEKHRIAHSVDIVPGTQLAGITKAFSLSVNSRHGEYVAVPSERVVISARSKDDGIAEAIEIPNRKFAFGLQWHQEDFWRDDHAGNKIFGDFIRLSR